MSTLIVILHVLAAILLIGPVAVSTSLYAPLFRKAQGGDPAQVGALQLVTRVTRSYGFLSLLVPAFGVVALLTIDGAMKNGAFHAALVLAIVAWGLLIGLVIPRQRLGLVALGAADDAQGPASEQEKEKAAALDVNSIPKQAAMFGGIFNLLWLITAVLMFV
ncbi:MAG TPA: hypothetical protein H9867_01490 [Candidatus Corynebacterium gallistercoris]|uniref:DUF2269 domain-containing protein n=1 Tax=Candidatus Corynebacterium gallistercoris TaxID=2838530 RepID=A0A9D1RYT6_9CORY|nr:hypothetical protein [Candidatus Corynebacterium gallistercoris]